MVTQLVCEGGRVEKQGCETPELMFSPLPNTAYDVLFSESLQELVSKGHSPKQVQARWLHLCAPSCVWASLFTEDIRLYTWVYEKPNPALRLSQKQPL